jgi:hypothetical protein
LQVDQCVLLHLANQHLPTLTTRLAPLGIYLPPHATVFKIFKMKYFVLWCLLFYISQVDQPPSLPSLQS